MTTANAKLIRVLLVDDHAIVRAGLKMLIESQSSFQLVGEASNGAEAHAATAREQPDVIVLDIDLNGESGLDLLPELLNDAPHARVLVLTCAQDLEVHRRAMQSGAMGLVTKDKAAEMLLKAITKVYAGEIWFDRSMMGSVLSQMSRVGKGNNQDPEAVKMATLTEREREIITLIGEGLKNKQIADRLFISETTVRHHLTSIFAKLEVSDRLELIIYAFRHNLAQSPR